MNDLVNIAAMQIAGIVNTPQAQGKALGQGDLGNFLTHLSKQLQASDTVGKVSKTPSADAVTSAEIVELSEKIAALLKSEKALPDSLANISLEELKVKITNLIQQGNILPNSLETTALPDITTQITELLKVNTQTDNKEAIKTSLLSDISSKFSLQTNDADKLNTEKLPVEIQLAKLLSEGIAKTPNVDMAAATEILSQTEAGVGKETTIDDLLLQLHAQAEDAGIELDPEILKQLTAKVEALLGDSSKEITPEALVELKENIIQELKTQGIEPEVVDKYLVTLAKQLKSEHVPIEKVDNKIQTQAQPKIDIATLEKTAQQNPTAPIKDALTQKTDNNAQYTITSKISGMSINPQTINAIAGGGESNTPDFMQSNPNNNTINQNISTNTSALKTTQENAQSFTNYLNEAKGTTTKTTQMINLQLQRNINAKVTSMKIQLVPHDLGKLDIELNFAADGSMKAHLIAEKPETLAMLKRDAHFLEKTLQDAGLSTDKDSLSFDLKQNNPQQQNLDGYKNENNNNNDFASHMDGMNADELLQAQIAVEAMGYATSTGINITV